MFVEAMKLIHQAHSIEQRSPFEAIALYKKAITIIQKIINDYAKSDLAVKIIRDDPLFKRTLLVIY